MRIVKQEMRNGVLYHRYTREVRIPGSWCEEDASYRYYTTHGIIRDDALEAYRKRQKDIAEGRIKIRTHQPITGFSEGGWASER